MASGSQDSGTGTDPPDGPKRELDSDEQTAIRILLQERLEQCGWCSVIKQKIRDKLRERGGLGNITREELSDEIFPVARDLVPESVYREMNVRVREILEGPFPQPIDE